MVKRRIVLKSGAMATVAALAPSRTLAQPSSVASFPADFIWGASTAGHQIEGNNVNSDCWALEQTKPTVFAEPSSDAANSFELWPLDIELVRMLGLGAYRFSIEWSRIEPARGQFSTAILDHYKRIVDTCRELGVRPFVTFNHFTVPLWFAERGGWMANDAADLFANFCDRAARHLAAGIDHAITLNEPNLSGLLRELLPSHLIEADRSMMRAVSARLAAPAFFTSMSLSAGEPQRLQRNLLAGHAAGKAAIKAVRGDLPVGVTLAMLDEQEGEPGSQRNAVREKFYGAWLRMAAKDDFVGVQNYERRVWTKSGLRPAPKDAVRNTMGAEVWPGSLAGAVRYAHQATGVPVIVTEHGVGTDDDRIRQWLIPRALLELQKAMADGVPVKGYLHWSLIDNFEWLFGYRIHFGLASLDRTTFVRTPKPSALIYHGIVSANAVRRDLT